MFFRMIRGTLLRQWKKMILIAITHNEALAQRICTRMIHIEELQGE